MRTLTGAALMLLAVSFAAVLGASKAAAAPQHATTVHKISACGAVLKTPGTYELTKSITDSGNGSCITIYGDNITLYLDGHTITGTGSDSCIYVEDGNGETGMNQHIVGGSMKKPTMTATLKNCEYGLYVYYTSGTMASHLKIDSPTSDGVFEEYSAGMTLSNLDAPVHANSAYGFYFEYGAGNVITHSTVEYNGGDEGVYIDEETADQVTYCTVSDPYSNSGGSGTGFEDEYSSRDVWSHDTSKGQAYGFYLYSDGYGPVTVTHDTATDLNSTEYGFYIYLADQEADYGSKYHTLVSDNKANGFKYGFFDEADSSYSVAEKWTNNTADNYTEYGFYIYYPTDYTFTGNVADAHTDTKKYDGSSTTYGFYLYDPYSYYPFATFSKNAAYDSEYGFYSDEYAVAGKGNVAKRDKYATYLVQANS